MFQTYVSNTMNTARYRNNVGSLSLPAVYKLNQSSNVRSWNNAKIADDSVEKCPGRTVLYKLTPIIAKMSYGILGPTISYDKYKTQDILPRPTCQQQKESEN